MDTNRIVPLIKKPSTWKFPDVIEEARKVCPATRSGKKFNSYGLAYTPTEELVFMRKYSTFLDESTQNNEMKNKMRASAAEYADVVTHAFPDAVWATKKIPRQISLEYSM